LAKTVDHRPEVNCDGAQHNWWSYLLNGQFAEAQTKPVTILLVKRQSTDSRLASNWPLWLHPIQDLSSICTGQAQTTTVQKTACKSSSLQRYSLSKMFFANYPYITFISGNSAHIKDIYTKLKIKIKKRKNKRQEHGKKVMHKTNGHGVVFFSVNIRSLFMSS